MEKAGGVRYKLHIRQDTYIFQIPGQLSIFIQYLLFERGQCFFPSICARTELGGHGLV